MRKLALISISARVSFDPVFAHLGLVLVFGDLIDTLVILGGGNGLLRGIAGACGWSEGGFKDHLQWRDVGPRDELLWSGVDGEWIAAQLRRKWVCFGAHLLL